MVETCKDGHEYKIAGYTTQGGDGRGDGEPVYTFVCQKCGKKICTKDYAKAITIARN